jgi:DNA helicase-2/ATP-dependent DNA helicase PcrA
MIGGFSFYDRAEIKDLLSYLKLVKNPDDSIALARVINTPARGIGKTSMETLERLALETGSSVWTAMGHAITNRLLSNRACTALDGFRRMIADARAMLSPGFAEKLTADIAASTIEPENPDDDTSFDFKAVGFDFGPSDSAEPTELTEEPLDDAIAFDPAEFNPFDPAPAATIIEARVSADPAHAEEAATHEGFRKPGDAATLPELIKFIIDRSGYIRALEEEATPESFSRIENLKELVNAAQDAHERGETLDQFLDHAALVSDADQYDPTARITLMTLHAAKGLEFPLVLLAGMEEGLFPHSRTLTEPDQLEEERRLCYVGLTRAMDTLIITRARYRRRYGADMPEVSMPSRFLEEIPAQLMQDLGGASTRGQRATRSAYDEPRHYSYEDEDQSYRPPTANRAPARTPQRSSNSLDNIAQFFSARGQKFSRPKIDIPEPTGKTGLRSGTKVRHPKYGEGVVFKREGDGEDAKLTVQFARFGVKKLVEKFAQLEKI